MAAGASLHPGGSGRSGNRFLDALSAESRSAVVRAATSVTLPLAETIAHAGDAIAYVHFPLCGAISEVEEQQDGGSAEVTVVGREGLSPLEPLLGELHEQRRRLVQVPTDALAVEADALATLRDRFADLRDLAARYAVATLRVAGIGLACNARHTAPVRLARWLLRMHDRAGNDQFELTHEATALMLAVRRPTVTLAINDLVTAGAIESRRGMVRVLDRAKLEAITCTCYAEGHKAIERVYATKRTDEA